MIEDKIIDRIRKILALAGNNPNEHERDTAMKMAQKLLAKHNLSMEEIEFSGQAAEEVIEDGDLYVPHSYIKTLSVAVGKLYFCNTLRIVSRSHRQRFIFIGRESNVATSREIFAYVIKAIEAEARTQARRQSDIGFNRYVRSFCNGASVTICDRVRQLLRETEQQRHPTSTGRDLVLADVYAQRQAEAEKYIAQRYQTKPAANSRMQLGRSITAHENGTAFGRTVNLHRSLPLGES